MNKKTLIISAVLFVVVAVGLVVLLTGVSGENFAGRLVRKILPAYNVNNVYQCSDGMDNDNDGYTDYPDDIRCSNKFDTELKEIPVGCSLSEPILWATSLPNKQYYSSTEVFNYIEKAKKSGVDGNCYITINNNNGPILDDETTKNKFVFVTNMSRIDVYDDNMAIDHVANYIKGLDGSKNTFSFHNDKYFYPSSDNSYGYATYNSSWADSESNWSIVRSFTVATPSYAVYRIASGNVDWDYLNDELSWSGSLEGNSSFEVSFSGTDLSAEPCPKYFEQMYPYTSNNLSWEAVKDYVSSSISLGDDSCQLAVVMSFSYSGVVVSPEVKIQIKNLDIDSATKKISYKFNNEESFTIDLSKKQPEFIGNVFSHNEGGEGGIMYIDSGYFTISRSSKL